MSSTKVEFDWDAVGAGTYSNRCLCYVKDGSGLACTESFNVIIEPLEDAVE
jgi:hypothetical protein